MASGPPHLATQLVPHPAPVERPFSPRDAWPVFTVSCEGHLFPLNPLANSEQSKVLDTFPPNTAQPIKMLTIRTSVKIMALSKK